MHEKIKRADFKKVHTSRKYNRFMVFTEVYHEGSGISYDSFKTESEAIEYALKNYYYCDEIKIFDRIDGVYTKIAVKI